MNCRSPGRDLKNLTNTKCKPLDGARHEDHSVIAFIVIVIITIIIVFSSLCRVLAGIYPKLAVIYLKPCFYGI